MGCSKSMPGPGSCGGWKTPDFARRISDRAAFRMQAKRKLDGELLISNASKEELTVRVAALTERARVGEEVGVVPASPSSSLPLL
jgi:hypothetical protein